MRGQTGRMGSGKISSPGSQFFFISLPYPLSYLCVRRYVFSVPGPEGTATPSRRNLNVFGPFVKNNATRIIMINAFYLFFIFIKKYIVPNVRSYAGRLSRVAGGDSSRSFISSRYVQRFTVRVVFPCVFPYFPGVLVRPPSIFSATESIFFFFFIALGEYCGRRKF